MKNKFLKAVLIYIPVMALIFLIVYFSGYFTALHENAYRDIFRSVTIPYALYLIYLFWKSTPKMFSIKKHNTDTACARKSDVEASEKTPSLHNKLFDIWGKQKAWFNKEQNVVYDILEVFMLFTVINSIMMVFGIDPYPKDGKFAYIHLTMRFTIITCIMIVIRGKKTISDIQSLIHFFSDSVFKHCLSANLITNIYRCTYVIYTLLTILICILTIIFSSNPIGGIPFYFYLTFQFFVIILVVVIINTAFVARAKK